MIVGERTARRPSRNQPEFACNRGLVIDPVTGSIPFSEKHALATRRRSGKGVVRECFIRDTGVFEPGGQRLNGGRPVPVAGRGRRAWT